MRFEGILGGWLYLRSARTLIGSRTKQVTRSGKAHVLAGWVLLAFQILIADDNDLMRGALRTVLQNNAEYRICGEAANGLEAVEQTAELQPDLVILDLVMPVMDGLRAAREISGTFPGTAILLHTWHASSEVEMEAKKNGAAAVVGKAAGLDVLLETVSILLKEPAGKSVRTGRRRGPRDKSASAC